MNPLNYGLYFPSTGRENHGKFMVDSNLLIDYALEGNVPKLEVSATGRRVCCRECEGAWLDSKPD